MLEQIELLLEKGCHSDLDSLVLAEGYGSEALMNLLLPSTLKHTKIECRYYYGVQYL